MRPASQFKGFFPLSLARWMVRQAYRKERRQQSVIVLLIAAAMAVPTAVVLVSYRLDQAAQRAFGRATHQIVVFETDRTPADVLAAMQAEFGPVQLEMLQESRATDSGTGFALTGVTSDRGLGAPPLRVRQGSLPRTAAEAAASPSLAAATGVRPGSELSTETGRFVISGVVEDPRDLNRQFLLVQLDAVPQPELLAFAVAAREDQITKFDGSANGLLDFEINPLNIQHRSIIDGGTGRFFIAMGLLELVLLSGAGFSVIGRRRLHELGMLSAVGASSKELRRTLATNGILSGIIGAATGAAIGLGLASALAPVVEQEYGRRLAGLKMPLGPLAGLAVLVTSASAFGAWWPAHHLTRASVMEALAARRPSRSRPVVVSAIAGTVALAGVSLLVIGYQSGEPGMAIPGALVLYLGLLGLCPLAVHSFGLVASLLPLSGRLALRDIARNSSRSFSVMAALVVALGLPATIVVTSESADASLDERTVAPNLPDNTAIVWRADVRYGVIADDEPPTDLKGVEQRLRAAAPNSRVVPFGVVARRAPSDSWEVLRYSVRSSNGGGTANTQVPPEAVAWTLAPDALPNLNEGIGTANGDPIPELTGLTFTGVTGPVNLDTRDDLLAVPLSRYRSIPDVILSNKAIAQAGFQSVAAGWIIIKDRALSLEELNLIQLGLDEGLQLERQEQSQDNSAFRRIVVLTGAIAAFTILALTMTLLKTEARGEALVLAAVGARRITRRRVLAAQALSLSMASAGAALVMAYAGLYAIRSETSAEFPVVVPIPQLMLLLAVVPLSFVLVTYLLVPREPDSMRIFDH